MKKISHALILIDNKVGMGWGEGDFARQILADLKSDDGRSYSQFLDRRTKIAVHVVGPQDWENQTKIVALAIVGGKKLFNPPPEWDDMHYQNFACSVGSGTAITEWVDA